ncbi:MAG: ATP synthase F1 subunit gamma [Oscillospiraceae bacterium]|nr:ATP synthase F1 subunit gamma [Oscillospiraceae bacterium]
MQNINEIRHHISAVAETRKITSAMQIVASSRMKKVLGHIAYNQLYSERLKRAIREILLSSPAPQSLPYLMARGGERRTYIVIAGDKGMAGSYNANLLHYAYAETKGHPNYHLITCGLKASAFFHRNGIQPDIEIMGVSQDPSLANARTLASDVIDIYDKMLTDEVYIIYTMFSGPSRHLPVMNRLLPLLPKDYDEIPARIPEADIIYVPSPEEAFHMLIPQFLTAEIFSALAQAYSSEHFARMNAMQSATRNADELMKKLTMQYNMARQAAITREITEISGAVEALRNGDEAYATGN